MMSFFNMMIYLLSFIAAIAILVTVHEFGHFWVARKFGIKVLRFSIGFGNPLFRWYDKLGTEYVIAAIPLGGYVSMLGERGGPVSPLERHMSYDEKPVGVRMAVLFAGPLFNLLFAVLAFWVVFFSGISVVTPILGKVSNGTPAYIAGLKGGQEIVSVEGKATPTWAALRIAFLNHMGEDKTLVIESKEPHTAKTETHLLDVSQMHMLANKKESDFLEEVGLIPLDPFPAVVGALKPGLPAENAGIKIGDRITGVNGISDLTRSELALYIQAHTGEVLKLQILRDNKTLEIPVQPVLHRLENGKSVGFIGVDFQIPEAFPKEFMHLERYGAWESLVKAYQRTQEYTVLTFIMIKKLIVGAVSPKMLSGPIAIAKYAGQSVSIGFEYFLSFLAIISISLGVFNLLPIPILDGGHLLFCVIELIRGKPVSAAVQTFSIWLGGSFLVGITLIAFYNDILRL
jgi:regulator of sigma E protease